MTLPYTQTPERVIVNPSIDLNLTKSEVKLILRLRQTRRKGERRNFIIDPLNMTLTPVELSEIERLDGN